MTAPEKPLGVLLSGFGPFPGIEHNVSGAFADDLAMRVAAQHPHVACSAVQLETEWASAPRRIADTIVSTEPRLVVLFGVAREARGLVLERCAHNACNDRPDASGFRLTPMALSEQGPPTRASTLPIAAIIAALSARGTPVSQSDNAGRYLCNAVLYEALAAADRMVRPAMTGFVHLPVAFSPTTIDRAAALDAGLHMISVCLTTLTQQR